MKVNFKRMAATGLAVVMSLGLSVSAFAAPGTVATTAPLTVTGEQLGGKNVTAVRMFEARAIEGAGENAYTYDSYVLEDEWLPFFKANAEDGGIGKETLDAVPNVDFKSESDTEYKEAASAYINTLEDDNGAGTLADFADKAQDWYEAHIDTFYMIGETKAVPEAEEGETRSSVTFDALATGYYLVFPELGSTGDNSRNTDAMLINVPTTKEGATWNIKSVYPTVNKTVQNGDGEFEENGSASVGDTVTFKLESKVPDMSDYDKYVFKFVDTLTNGLDVNTESVQVTIGSVNNDTLKAAYSVNLEPETNVLTITFNDMKTIDGINPGDTISVTYTATINDEAIAGTPAENEVKLEYSNSPDGSGFGESTPDVTDVYVYDIDVHKYTGDWTGSGTAVLGDATFVLSTSQNDPIESTSHDDGNTYTDEVIDLVEKSTDSYRVATTSDLETTNEFTTDTGVINIDGLAAGTYYLHEIKAPAGYNKLSEPITIVIAPTTIAGEAPEDTTIDYSKPVYTIGDADESQGQDNTVAVKNNSGTMLPETGSIGTIGLTAAGVVIVLLGVFAPRKKKKSNQE